MWCLTASAGNTTSVKHLGDSKYVIASGDLSMTIDGGAGGRILSFKHKKNEIISQLQYPESFGSTFWTSPQKEWNWPPVPEYDKQPYVCEERPTSVYMTSQASAKHKYAICKEFAVDPADNAFVITYTIINVSFEPRSVAPWEVTRVINNDGLVFFDAAVDQITTGGGIDDGLNFESAFDVAWYATDVADKNRKVQSDGKGWLAYASNGLLLVKKFSDIDPKLTAPNESEIEVYVNQGKTHIELESQGAYTLLMPGQQTTWTVRWYLMPYKLKKSIPSQDLLNKVRSIVK